MENKSFVYNSGEDEIAEDGIKLVFGLFFDGTLNNRANSELRKKYRNGIDPSTNKPITERHIPQITIDDTPEQIAEKELLYKQAIDREEADFENLKNKDLSENDSEYERYLKASNRGKVDKLGVDNSFSNDFTNVARMWFSCERAPYGIYVEGIGTLDSKRDVDDGFQYGSGFTGVRGKVRNGCEELAKRIGNLKAQLGGKDLTDLTIDVFGFSRGAAAARNFLYEINRKQAYKPTPDKVAETYIVQTTPNYGNDFQSERYATRTKRIKLDSDGKEVDPSFLIDGKMPKMGHLGYSLLKNNILTVEEFNMLQLHVRFLGVYDTVSSYEEFGDMGFINRTLVKGGIHATLGSQHNFGDDVKQLQLNNMGTLRQAVHFTAQNEHRENFDLTRFPVDEYKLTIGIEKNLPGVHCDIGGAYETGTEVVDELEVFNKHPGVGFNSYSSWNPYKKLENFKQKIIDDHWYYDEELSIEEEKYYLVFQYTKLKGTRFLRKEYSYIPLHFMEGYCKKYLGDKLIKQTETEYSIDDQPLLVSAKRDLAKYVFDNDKEWHFKTNAQLDQEQKLKEEMENFKLEFENQISTPISQEPMSTRVDRAIEINNLPPKKLPETRETLIEEVTVYGGTQGHLRNLRHNYLHWSANRDWLGMDPNNDRTRIEH